MPGVQSIDRFVEDRRARWARLGDLVARAGGRVSRLGADEVLELGALYRSTTSDLAIARRDFPLDAVAERLNDLVAAAHALVYSESPTSARRLRRFLEVEMPATVRASAPYTLAAAALLFGPLLFTFALGLLFPTIAAGSMSDELREHLVNRQPGAEIPAEMRPVAGPLIIANNVWVSMVAFAGGMTGGLLTAWVLVSNGVALGTTLAILQPRGSAGALVTFALSHGFLELSAVVLSGGAGLRVGWALLHPGDLSRGDALRLAGGQALRVLLLVIAVLGIAGTIEGFVSPTTLPAQAKLAVGLASGAWLWIYLLVAGRERAGGARERPGSDGRGA